MYALKFVMDRLLACLNDMGGFLDSNLSDTPIFFHHELIMETINPIFHMF
jgi:hypothetical protein